MLFIIHSIWPTSDKPGLVFLLHSCNVLNIIVHFTFTSSMVSFPQDRFFCQFLKEYKSIFYKALYCSTPGFEGRSTSKAMQLIQAVSCVKRMRQNCMLAYLKDFHSKVQWGVTINVIGYQSFTLLTSRMKIILRL